jgi:hypothetical protein
MDAYRVFNSIHRDEAIACTDKYVVVYNMGHAIREVTELGHSLPIGHYGVLEKSNSIIEKLIEGGFLTLVNEVELPTKKEVAPKKKATAAKTGYNPNATDGDGDGLVQDGTKWEREVK